MFKAIFDKVNVPLFDRMLDGSAARQRTIAENISNINTPGYQTKDVDFTELLNAKTSKLETLRSDYRHIPIGGSSSSENIVIERDNSQILESGVNNVDIDKEMVKTAENQLYYSATSRITAAKFKSLHKAITGK